MRFLKDRRFELDSDKRELLLTEYDVHLPQRGSRYGEFLVGRMKGKMELQIKTI